MRLLLERGADPFFVHEVHYVTAAGSYGAAGTDERTTTLMAAVGMGGRRMRAFVRPDPAEVEALTLEAVQLVVELGVDVDATDLQGRTAGDARSYPSVRDFLAAEAAR
jgi:hypothetical protein